MTVPEPPELPPEPPDEVESVENFTELIWYVTVEPSCRFVNCTPILPTSVLFPQSRLERSMLISIVPDVVKFT